MDIVYERCAALDLAKRDLVAGLRLPRHQEVRTFSTMTDSLLELADWLRGHGVRRVAMEATGSFWKPVCNLLEAYDFELMLARGCPIRDPHDFKAVPGRKTDVKDAEWLADLLRHGLLRGSFVPDRAHRELRELVRYRKSLVEERTREVNGTREGARGGQREAGRRGLNAYGEGRPRHAPGPRRRRGGRGAAG